MADFYTLLTNAGIEYETACKAAGTPIKLTAMSVGDGNGAIYNPDATATALKREVWRGPLNALFQDSANPSWLLAEVTIPPDVGGWYVREAGLWTDTGILYAIVKYPESFKPVLASSGSGKEFYIRSIFETSNAAIVTLLIDDTIVKATRAWVASYVADEIAKLDFKQSVRVATTANIVLSAPQIIDGVAVVAGDRVLVKNQAVAKDNGIYVAATGAWARAKDADVGAEVTSALIVSVEQGATLADTRWQLVTDGVIVLGTTPLIFQDVLQGYALLSSPAFVGIPTAPTAAAGSNSQQIATTAFVEAVRAILAAATALKAPLASPALTGTPTAPTAPAGTNSQQIATTAFIQSALAALVNSAPAALDQINELAQAINNDPNFAVTMINALSLKAPLASPGLTGIPTAPTAAPGANTGQLATTAFVAAAGALKANIASPGFTGTPAAPNPPTGNRSNQIATMQKFADEFPCALGVNSWQQLPTGQIKQFGAGTISANGGVAVYFPLAFPNGCTSLTVSDQANSQSSVEPMGAQVVDKASFQAWYKNVTAGTFYWMAEGW